MVLMHAACRCQYLTYKLAWSLHNDHASLYQNLYLNRISGVATLGPTRAQALVEFVCALVNLLNSQA